MVFRTTYPSSALRARFRLYAPLVAFFLLLVSYAPDALAQTDSDRRAYSEAVTKLMNQADSGDLERFASTTGSEFLKKNALEWLVAVHMRRGDARAKTFGEQLLSREPENALGLAASSNVMAQQAAIEGAGADAEKAISTAKRALRVMSQLKAPELMSESEFARLKDALTQHLNGSVGYAYYQRNDYVSARDYLRKAVALAPDNAQYTYALAICNLFGRDGNEAEGFKLLARTVNLTQGTPAGQEVASFARGKYEERGGSSSDWERYLAVTKTPGSSAAAGTAEAKATTEKRETRATAMPSPAQNQPVHKNGKDKKITASTRSEVASAQPETDLTAPSADVSPFPRKREVAPPGSAFSLGILVQTAQASHQGKRAVVNTLSDMVRHLREGDEAFLVSFSKNVAFEEDLTGNAKLLERAMDQIRPAPGTALFDAVAFAAGHLNRIARNRKRVLLVVSDGQNETSQISPLELAGELKIGDVEIYCIGISPNTRQDQYRLQSLAAKTGGQALFVADASQFRSAANRVATDLGIALR